MADNAARTARPLTIRLRRAPTPAAVIAAVLAAVLAAGACGDRPDAPGTVADPRGPAPAAADTASSLPTTWALAPAAFGPLRIGMRAAEVAVTVPGTLSLELGVDSPCAYAQWDRAPAGVRLMFSGDTLVRVDADGAAATTLGARVGDPEARIDSLYGPAVRRLPHKYTSGRYLVVVPPQDTVHRLVFETDGARVTRVRAGRLPQVEWVEGCG